MTVTTVFASTGDGYIESSNANYSLARSGSNLIADDTATVLRVGQFIFGIYLCDEAFVSFDTSAIPDTDAVSAVTLDTWLTGDLSATDFELRAISRDWGSNVSTLDFVPGSELATLDSGVVASRTTTAGGWAVGVYITWGSQPAFLTVPNLKTGTVRLCLYSFEQGPNNSAPAGNEVVEFASADTAGTANDPKLTVTHAAVPSRAPAQSFPNRIWRVA